MTRYEAAVPHSNVMRYIELQGQCENMSSYPSNSIITSKYTKRSFVPRALFSQFRSAAMIWFLLISILELTTLNQNVSVNVGTIIPLLLLILIAMLREGWNDYLRHISDDSLNNTKHPVWNGKEFLLKLSKEIQVGDLILLYDEEYSPADVLILASGNQAHECYVEASAIYGEASLKIKHAVKETQMTFDTTDLQEACLHVKLLNEDLFVCLPNPDFRHLTGWVKMRLSPKNSKIDMQNAILRGMKLTHTAWVIAVAVYTGEETKVWINNLQKNTKKSRLLEIVDRWVLWMLPLIALVCVVNTIAAASILPMHRYSWQEVLSSNIILFGHMIPISLILSIEITQAIHSFIIKRNSQVRVNSADLFSNLGMVEYIVTDKTGTLTENDLKISFCVIGGKVYWDRESPINDYSEDSENDYKKLPGPQMFEEFGEALTFADLEAGLAQAGDYSILPYVLCMALSNFAFPSGEGEYSAILVDDREMAKAAAKIGIKLIERAIDHILVSVLGSQMLFDVLGFIQFSSAKKLSRVMVRDQDSGTVSLYVKGCREAMVELYADDHSEDEVLEGFRTIYMGFKALTKKESKNFLLEYNTAKKSPLDVEGRVEAVFQKYDKRLEYLGFLGLEDSISEETIKTVRTLKSAGLKFWLLSGDSEDSTLAAAKTAEFFQPQDRILHLTNLRSELHFLEVIQGFIHSGIFDVDENSLDERLTDKKISEKEIDIHEAHDDTSRTTKKYSGSLFIRKSIVSHQGTTRQSLGNRSEPRLHLTSKRNTINPKLSKLTTVKRRNTNLHQSYFPDKLNFILSIDGAGLDYALTSKHHTKYFMSLIFAAKFACFHSLYPDHKKKVVQMLKRNFSFRPLVLGVGDGISDIGMIHEADIGVGIEGKEGLDAANSSDISLRHFSQLEKLILIDGHRQYIQLSKMVLLSWYAMALIETILFIYNCVTEFSAYSLVQKEYVTVYRLVVSIVPLTGMCLLDKESSSTVITPQAYKVGIFNTMLTVRNLMVFSAIGIIQAVVTFIFTQLTFTSTSQEGFTENALIMGSSLVAVLFPTILISVFIETYCISYKTALVYVFSFILFMAACLPLSYTDTELFGNANMMGSYNTLWIYAIFTIAINASVCYFFKCIRYIFYPGILEMITNTSSELRLRKKSRIEYFRNSLQKVFRPSLLFQNNIVHDTDKINEKLMKFSSEFREILYQNDKKTENKSFNYIFLSIGSIGVLAYTIYLLSLPPSPSPSNLIFCIIVSLSLACTFFFPRFIRYQKYSSTYLPLSLLSFQLFFFISDEVLNNYSLCMYCFIPVLYLIGFSNHWLEVTISVALASIFVIINIITSTTLKIQAGPIENAEIIVSYSAVYVSICLVASIAGYFIDKSGRIEFNLVQKVQVEIHKTKSVLGYLLPAFVRKRVKNGVRYIVEDQGTVSIIFCDIYNFEDILKIYQPQELTVFLDELFGKIDQKCSLSGCTKIETVGKTYMACAGLKDTYAEQEHNFAHVSHARRTVEMGISILNLCENIYLKNGDTLKVKIGINSGPVTAGVVGYHKPQFSLVGDTVNTASRMALLCPGPNTIQISMETFMLLDDTSGLQLLPFTVVAKGKGQMQTYLVSILVKDMGTPGSMSPLDIGMFTCTPSKKLSLRNSVNLGKEATKRKSSMIEDLNEVILDDAEEFKKNETLQLDEIKFFSFSCFESTKEETLRKEYSEANQFVSKAGLKIRIFCDLVILFFAFLESISSNTYQVYTIVKLFIELFFLILLLSRFSTAYKSLSFSRALGSLYLVGGALRLFDSSKNTEVVFIDYLLYMLQASFCSQLLFNTLSWCITLVACIQIIACATADSPVYLSIISSIIFLATLLCTIYSSERKLRIFSRIKRAAEKELDKTDELLTKMMPGNALAKLKLQSHVTEYIHGVTILYADIAGFTQWSADKLPEQVVGMLSNLFTEFDYKCVEYEVYKVHTIGDCYVALGYTGNKPRSEVVECYNLARFALDLVKTIEDVNSKHEISLGMRIGIHTGDIIGGITGTSIIRYDIYGTDVLVANKMESTGKVGKVHISQQTMKILMKNYPREFKFVEAEKIISPITESEVPTYFLEKYENGLVI